MITWVLAVYLWAGHSEPPRSLTLPHVAEFSSASECTDSERAAAARRTAYMQHTWSRDVTVSWTCYPHRQGTLLPDDPFAVPGALP